MFALFVRIILGFVLACLAAATTKVAFVITPADILALPPDQQAERLARAGVLILAVATQTAVFAAPFALITIAIAQLRRIGGWPFYVYAGLIISLIGLAVLFMTESPARPTIANAYAVAAYTFAGMIGGYVYWVVAGRVGRLKAEERSPVTAAAGPSAELKTKSRSQTKSEAERADGEEKFGWSGSDAGSAVSIQTGGRGSKSGGGKGN